MKIVNGKIVEATQSELKDYYFKQRYYDLYSLTDFINRMAYNGVKIVGAPTDLKDGKYDWCN